MKYSQRFLQNSNTVGPNSVGVGGAFFGITGILAGGSVGTNCVGEEKNTLFIIVLKMIKYLKITRKAQDLY